jgi:DNA polymerase IV (DinB-like DNA polymerase)
MSQYRAPDTFSSTYSIDSNRQILFVNQLHFNLERDPMNEKRRIIFHFDMDHFFTAIEEREHPELNGKPVIVGADPKGGTGRGVVSTSNYPARKFGVRSGMPISRAWKLCPDAAYLPVNYKLYLETSSRIMNILRRHADKFEQWGIDEAFLDVTSKVNDYASAEALARQIKDEIYAQERLTSSVGISSNKLVAKIASDFQKPDGLTLVKEEDVERFLTPLPVRKLLWVGRKTGQKLEDMDIKTVGDLAHYDPSILTDVFGEMGKQLHLMALGLDKSDVQERNWIKSISRELTFQEDTDNFDSILRDLDKLSEEVYTDALKQRLTFKTVTVKVRYSNFETHTHGKTFPFITNRLMDVEKAARELLQPYLKPERKIRLIGVRVSSLVSSEKQRTLFQ